LPEYAAPTGLNLLLGVGFYKDVAPTVLGFSSEKLLPGDNVRTLRPARPAFPASESADLDSHPGTLLVEK
jgi:hypothetical protein